ncbi:glycoside hydrolase family 28 protein [Geofilum sp. OHC36d9]|uniref:glycoside hydrolase family 28 protein n=1 Tax=Geofilum sp. OHC36d9 TaxID=3458413 RepID=UPI0040335ECB
MRKKIGWFIWIFMALGFFVKAQNGWLNVADLGADTTGEILCTDIIKQAITTASEKGGGTVFFPAGEYLTGPIVMESNITLFLDAGALIKFSNNFDDYLPFVQTRWEGTVMMTFSPLIYAHGQENITVTGRGKIDGQGRAWWNEMDRIKDLDDKNFEHKYSDLWSRLNSDVVTEAYYQSTLKMRFFRPPMIQFFQCSNILVEGVTIVNSPFWTINPVFSDNIVINGITIINPPSPNTDGINPSSCRNVRISNCHISVGDDCITIKSGRDIDGRKWAVPTENVTITNCTMLRGHGGVVIGSEVSGDVRKITISNCVFDGTHRGIRLKSARGRGGVVEEIRVDNVVMKNIKREAIVFNLLYDPKTVEEPVSERTPVFRNIHISNVTATRVKKACLLRGISEMPIENLSFNNINIQAETGFIINQAKNIELHDVDICATKGPSFVASEVSGLVLDNVKSSSPLKDEPTINLINVNNVYVHSCSPLFPTSVFLKVEGEKSQRIYLYNNSWVNVKKTVVKGPEVMRMSVKKN